MLFRMYDSHVDRSIIAEGCYLEDCEIRDSVVGIRMHVGHGARITRSVLLGADYYPDDAAGNGDVALGIGRDVVLDRVIVDKNARIAAGVRLVNDTNALDGEGDGWFIRDGIIVVPKGAVVTTGVGGR